MLASPFGHMLTKSFHLDFICDKYPNCLIPVSISLGSKLGCELNPDIKA